MARPRSACSWVNAGGAVGPGGSNVAVHDPLAECVHLSGSQPRGTSRRDVRGGEGLEVGGQRCVIAPTMQCVVKCSGKLCIVQGLAPCRHRAIERLPVDCDLTLQSIEHETREVVAAAWLCQKRRRMTCQSGECICQTLTVRLMAGCAGVSVGLRAYSLPLEHATVGGCHAGRNRYEQCSKTNHGATRHRYTLHDLEVSNRPSRYCKVVDPANLG